MSRVRMKSAYGAFSQRCFHRLVAQLDSWARHVEPMSFRNPVGQCGCSGAWSDILSHHPFHIVVYSRNCTEVDRICLCPSVVCVSHAPPWVLVCAVVDLQVPQNRRRAAHWFCERISMPLSATPSSNSKFCLQRSVPNSCIGGSGTATCVQRTSDFFRCGDVSFLFPPITSGSRCPHTMESHARIWVYSVMEPHQSNMLRWRPVATTAILFPLRCEGALNTCIGSSGAGALRSLQGSVVVPAEDSFARVPLLTVALAVVAFFHSLLLMVMVANVKALLVKAPGVRAHPCRLIWLLIAQVPCNILLSFAVATPKAPVLDWSPANPPVRRPHGQRRLTPYPQSIRRGISTRLLLFLAGFASAPQCVWSMPTFLHDSEVGRLFRDELAHIGGTAAAEPSQEGFDQAEPEDNMPEHLPGTCIDLPRHVHGPAPYSTEKWLGVTVFAPHVAPTTCAVRAERTDNVECIIDRLRSTGRLPHPDFDMITAVHPQMHDGCLALLAYPSVIAQHTNPRSAVILDLSRVGGHCHAAVIRSDITPRELLQQVRLQIRADFDEEDLQVWVGDATIPASRLGLLSVTHGTLLTVMRSPYAPGSLPQPASLFVPAARWCRVDHMPTPPQSYSLALCRGQALDPICPAFFPWAQTADIVRSVYRLPEDDDKIVVLDNSPILDVQGEPCAQTAVAFSGTGLFLSQEPVQAYFLDLRLLGEAPRLVYLPAVTDKGA